ncbi:SDR family oxidoreductase [Mesobacterium pallidum]|uniref:SDR family oxidoreductase n=1 Tax=Mesobacterium pallidum TaxID=2872037 RepID=UPI001EE22226|nr:SDR family oxidoreductase [Mesobacterium pallidum]
MEMQGKRVIVTGASRGIGAETARAFAAAGAKVMLVSRGSGEIGKLADEIGGDAVAQACDVSDAGAVAAMVAKAGDLWGGVDVLINNAGVIEPIARMDAADVAEWGRVIDINLKGVFYAMHAVLPGMIAQGGGTVLTVSSGAAHGPVEAWSHYCASKAGAAMLTSCLDKEYRDQGIRALGLSPGTVATQMQREIKASGINPVSRLEWTDHIPPDWPAKALLWMASADADDFIGTEISLRDEAIRKRLRLA